MPVEEGPAESFEPSEFANVAADAGIKGIEAFLALHGARARHILIVLDIEPASMPDPTAENATLAGQGYDDAEELFAELLALGRRASRWACRSTSSPRRIGSEARG